MASNHPGLRSRGPNRWQLIVSVKDPATGAHRQLTRMFSGSLTAARKARAEFITETNRGVSATSPLSDLLDRWLANIESEGRSDTTLYAYRCRVKTIKDSPLASVRLDRLRVADLNEWYSSLLAAEKSPADVRHYHAVLSAALNYGMAVELVHRNVAQAASPPKVIRKPIEVPSSESVARIVATADDDMAVFLRLAATVGARNGEICALRWSDFKLVTGATVVIGHSISRVPGGAVKRKTTKTNRARNVDIDQGSVAQVIAQMARARHRAEVLGGTSLVADPYLFSLALDGSTPYEPNWVSKQFKALCKTAGITGVRLHDFRHYVASRLLAAGRPVPEVAYRLGHTSSQMTLNVYGHFIPSTGTESADIMAELLVT